MLLALIVYGLFLALVNDVMQADKQQQALDLVREGADREDSDGCVPSTEERGAISKAQANGCCIAGAIVDEWVDELASWDP